MEGHNSHWVVDQCKQQAELELQGDWEKCKNQEGEDDKHLHCSAGNYLDQHQGLNLPEG